VGSTNPTAETGNPTPTTSDTKTPPVPASTNSIAESLAQIETEARQIMSFHLNWDGTKVYYDTLVEDNWFHCESSQGTITQLDLATGARSQIAPGTEPQLSPDGRYLAYLTQQRVVGFNQATMLVRIEQTVYPNGVAYT